MLQGRAWRREGGGTRGDAIVASGRNPSRASSATDVARRITQRGSVLNLGTTSVAPSAAKDSTSPRHVVRDRDPRAHPTPKPHLPTLLQARDHVFDFDETLEDDGTEGLHVVRPRENPSDSDAVIMRPVIGTVVINRRPL